MIKTKESMKNFLQILTLLSVSCYHLVMSFTSTGTPPSMLESYYLSCQKIALNGRSIVRKNGCSYDASTRTRDQYFIRFSQLFSHEDPFQETDSYNKMSISPAAMNIGASNYHNHTTLEAFERDISFVINKLTIGDDNTVYPHKFSTGKFTISRVWDLDLWRQSTSRKRYIHILFKTFTSSRLFKHILPQLTICTLWSIICMTAITKKLKTATTVVPLTSLSIVSTFIAFLLTLRSNQSLNRLAEARQLWGRLFIVTRDTAQMLSTYVYPKDKKLGIQAARHLSLLAWLLKDLLRDSNRDDIITTMLGESTTDSAYLKSQRKRSAAAIARIRQVVATVAARNELSYAPHQQLEHNLNEMNYILGMCERLKGSPIPPVYTSHATRLFAFYLLFLPCALHGSQVTKAVTVLVSATVSYAMLGLDEISHLLEQPFLLMPLHQLSKNIMLDIADAFICQTPSFQNFR